MLIQVHKTSDILERLRTINCVWRRLRVHLIWFGIFFASVSPAAVHAQGDNELENCNAQVLDLYRSGKYAEAIAIAERALALTEKLRGLDHPSVAVSLNNLAQLLKATNRQAEAEPLMRRALAIDEKHFGFEAPEVAIRVERAWQDCFRMPTGQGRPSPSIAARWRSMKNTTVPSIQMWQQI